MEHNYSLVNETINIYKIQQTSKLSTKKVNENIQSTTNKYILYYLYPSPKNHKTM